MSTITKLVLVAVLLFLLAGVSYIKSSLSVSGSSTDIEDIKGEYFKTQDSLHLNMLDDSTRHYIDSLVRLDRYYLAVIDSINKVYEDQTSELSDVNQKLTNENKKLLGSANDATTTKKKSTTAKKKVKPNPLQSKVRTEYRELSAKLPSDLT